MVNKLEGLEGKPNKGNEKIQQALDGIIRRTKTDFENGKTV